jgi:transposase
MDGNREAFIAFDSAKLKNAVAIAEGGRDGEVRYLAEIANTPDAVGKLVAKLAGKYDKLHFCYEAGPTGYGLYRQIVGLGHACVVVAPSLIPKRPGDRVKTNRRDAVTLAKLLRAGELTAVWVPDVVHEAIRDLVRARDAAVADLRRKRQLISAFLFRHGRIFSGKSSWRGRHARWLSEQSFAHPAHHVVLQEALNAAQDAVEQLQRLEAALVEIVPTWSMAPVVSAFQAMRGVSFIAAVIFVAELGDLRRFDNPRQLMSYLGLVPSERSTGERVRRGGITKAGNSRARRVLVEAAWTYRHAARAGRVLLDRMRDLPKSVRDIAWKAQLRLCSRHRKLLLGGKPVTVVARWRLSSGRSLARCRREQRWYEAHQREPLPRHFSEKPVRAAKARQGQPCRLPLARLAALTAFVSSDDSTSIGCKERKRTATLSGDPRPSLQPCRCQRRLNSDPLLECAPSSGRIEGGELTGYAGPSPGEGRWPSTVVTASSSSGRLRRSSSPARRSTVSPSATTSRAT